MRARLVIVVLCGCCALSALAAAPAVAARRVDLKVLLLGTYGTEPSFVAWQAQLRREGVPYDQLVATPEHTRITAATLAQTIGEVREGKYEAIIVAVGQLPRCEERGCFSALAAEEWAALNSYEQTYKVRQIDAYVYPQPEFGLNWPTFAGALEGTEATLTEAGRTAFPYLNRTVKIDTGTYGYGATPLEPTFTSLLADGEGHALVGTFRHEEGREELVQTFDGNQFQLHTQLLRHGELAWVTRGTYLGDERNYLEMHIDDVFLPDDIWDTTNHVTDYNPEDAVRMTAGDVEKAVEWSTRTGLHVDNLFNGGGSDQYAEEHEGRDPLLRAFQEDKRAFGWVNHTFDHPNLDCSTRTFITNEIEDNITWAGAKGFEATITELVTGEHSGLANLIPGNPGTIDPPGLEAATPSGSGGSLSGGRYDYAVTATSVNGETVGSTATVTVPAGSTGSTTLGWEAICQATSYKVYRRTSPEGTWERVATVAQPEPAFENEGPVRISWRDTGGSEGAATPPSVNRATLDPYAQNPEFRGALTEAGVTNVGVDASKPYPINPTNAREATYPANTSFMEESIRAIPRYPTNVYYNVATQAQLTDEYNHLYLPPEAGGVCVLTEITTCLTRAASWSDIVAAESQRIFGHMMGNDPRPHYFHQTNLAESEREEGAVFYPVIDAMLAEYSTYFNTTTMPIVQLTPTQIADLLARQEEWTTASESEVTGYVEGETVALANEGEAVQTPLTGTEVGSLYGGTRSGWTSVPNGASTYRATVAWP